MFKKSIEAKALQRLSGADRKKLKRSLKERFMLATDADLDAILPPKIEITIARLPNRAHVYSIEGGLPMIFDVDGRGSELFPTVFALWRVPDLLPAFILKGGEVSRFIIGGADLMFPGIAIPPDGFPSFLAGKPWSVKVPGNNAPIAVGSTMLSSIEAVKAGLRGKALHVLHFYRDSLWESVEGQLVPNAGFLEDMVVEDPSLLESTSVQQAYFDEAEIDTEKSHDSETNETPEEVIYAHQTDLEQRTCGSQHVDYNISDELTSHIGTLNVADKVPTTSAEENANDKDQHALSTEEVDALLDKCLLQALHTTIKDKDLPMSGSALWSSHVLPCRPVGVTLDIKRSSHKKLSKWLQSKSSGGLISAKEDKHKKEVILMSINRTHVDYTSFRPEKRTSATAGEITDTMKTGQQIKGKLELVEVYKSTTHVNPILVAVGADTGKYFSAPEVSEIVFSYVEKEKLVKPMDKALVILDATLCDALYKGTVKKGSSYPTEIHKKDLSATFLNRMQVHHVVVRDDKSTVRKGSVKPVQIMTERRQGSKKVTRLSGLETFLVDVESLSSEIQKKFACSTSVAELPGKKGQHELLVQGGVIDDLAKHLVDHYGIPKRYIEVLDKTKR